jgi:hypothetical protein
LLRRSAGVVPGFVKYLTGGYEHYIKKGWTRWIPTRIRRENHYQWDEFRQELVLRRGELYVNALDYYYNIPQQATVSWATKPTSLQARLIRDGETTLLNSIYPENGKEVRHLIHNRDGIGVQIINQQTLPVNTFFGLSRQGGLMCTCKQIRCEAAAVLYGRNEFMFDLRRLKSLDEGGSDVI